MDVKSDKSLFPLTKHYSYGAIEEISIAISASKHVSQPVLVEFVYGLVTCSESEFNNWKNESAGSDRRKGNLNLTCLTTALSDGLEDLSQEELLHIAGNSDYLEKLRSELYSVINPGNDTSSGWWTDRMNLM